MCTFLFVLLIAQVAFTQTEHRFFDKPARFSLGASAAVFATDAVNSCRTPGHEEWLPVQSCYGISLWMAGNVAQQVGASWLLHKTHHHRLERIAEVVGATGSALGIAFTIKNRAHVRPSSAISIVPVYSNPTFCIVGKTC